MQKNTSKLAISMDTNLGYLALEALDAKPVIPGQVLVILGLWGYNGLN